jgi:hypothetical protein
MEEVLARCMTRLEAFEGDDKTPINVGGGCEGVMSAVTDPFIQE